MDRLADLRSGLDDELAVPDDTPGGQGGDIETGDGYAAGGGAGGDAEAPSANDKELAKFYREIEAIKSAINKIDMSADKLDELYKSPGKEQEIQQLIVNTDGKTQAIRKRLKRIAEENKAYIDENPNSVANGRIRVSTHQNVAKSFMKAMEHFEQVQEKQKKVVQKGIAKDLKSLNPNVADRDIMAAVENDNYGHLLDQAQLSGAHAETQTRLNEIRSRNQDIQELEKNIIELHQMFVDMSLLVENQGELLNSIEYNIGKTKEAAKDAEIELIQARKNQKAARKKMVCLIIIAICIVCAIVIPIVVTQLAK